MFFRREKAPIDFLIVGLGNPGSEYDKTRHNSGFSALDYISGRSGIEVNRLKHSAKVGTGVIDGKKVMLMKPQTYMNRSGLAVSDAAKYYKIPVDHIILISDDISLDVGRVRIRRSGSAGGQKGLASVIECLGSDGFPRIKIGVGAKPNPEYDLADWVLSKFTPSEIEKITSRYDAVYEAIGLIMDGRIEDAMQKCN